MVAVAGCFRRRGPCSFGDYIHAASLARRLPFWQDPGTIAVSDPRRWARALKEFHEQTGAMPGQSRCDAMGRPLLSWRVTILPFLESYTTYKAFHLNEPWDSEHNLSLLSPTPEFWQSPYRPDFQRRTIRTHRQNFKCGKVACNVKRAMCRTVSPIPLCLSKWTTSTPEPWTKPADYEVVPSRPHVGIGHKRSNGILTVFGDGSVRVLQRIRIRKCSASLSRAGRGNATRRISRRAIGCGGGSRLPQATHL